MRCKTCGNEVPLRCSFCYVCGTRLVEKEEPECNKSINKTVNGNEAVSNTSENDLAISKNKTNDENDNVNIIYKNFLNSVKELENSQDAIYYINAGRMNHGKSSLINALVDKENLLATDDIRTTVKQEAVDFKDGIKFVDTPGLNAKNEDDEIAFDAYKKADMILFVHSPRIGELHRNELESINLIAGLFPSKQDFWNRFCLIFSFKEELEDADYEQIKDKSLSDLKNYCDGEGFPVFRVSSSIYWAGVKNKSEDLIAYSGIVELREYLVAKAEELSKESALLRETKLAALKEEATGVLKKLRKNYEEKYNAKRRSLKEEEEEILEMVKNLKAVLDKQKNDIGVIEDKIKKLRSEISSLKASHSKDKSKYWD